jgi:hypothetical protein
MYKIYIRSLSLSAGDEKKITEMKKKPRKEERNGKLIGGNSKTEGNKKDEKKRDQSELVVQHGH